MVEEEKKADSPELVRLPPSLKKTILDILRRIQREQDLDEAA